MFEKFLKSPFEWVFHNIYNDAYVGEIAEDLLKLPGYKAAYKDFPAHNAAYFYTEPIGAVGNDPATGTAQGQKLMLLRARTVNYFNLLQEARTFMDLVDKGRAYKTSPIGVATTKPVAFFDQEIHLNFLYSAYDKTPYPGVERLLDLPNDTGVTAGTAGKANVIDINDKQTGVSFFLKSPGASPGHQVNIDGGADPSNNTVYAKQYIAFHSWLLQEGTAFRISGLVPGRFYRLFFWVYSTPSTIVNFTCNGVTTPNSLASSGSKGDSAGLPLDDAVLRFCDVVPNSSGNIDGVCHYVSGTPANTVPLCSLYIARFK